MYYHHGRLKQDWVTKIYIYCDIHKQRINSYAVVYLVNCKCLHCSICFSVVFLNVVNLVTLLTNMTNLTYNMFILTDA